MRRLLLALCLLAIALNAHAGAWTLHSQGSLCAGSGCDNSQVSAPSSISVGDVILVFSAIGPAGFGPYTVAGGTPSGWTRVDTTNLDSDTVFNERIYCRVATGSDTMPTLNWNAGGIYVMTKAAAFSGPTAANCSTMVHASGATEANTTNSPNSSQSLTITDNNTLVIELWQKRNANSPVNFVSIGCPTDINTGQLINDHVVLSQWQQTALCYVVQTTAANVGSNGFTFSGTPNNTQSFKIGISLDEQDGTPPTFSVSPAIGTRTTSTILVTATTPCTDCTYYGIEQTAGAAAPTVAQVIAGQDHTGSAAFKACSTAMTTNVQGTCTFSSITDGTVRDGYYALQSTGGGNIAANVSIANQYKIPAFTTALTVASVTNTVYTSNSKVLDGAGSVYWVGCNPGASAPSVSQVEATSGGCIRFSNTGTATGVQTLTAPDSPSDPLYDLYYVGTYGSQHEAAVHSLTSQCLSPPASFQYNNCPSGATAVNSVGSLFKAFNDANIVTINYGSQTANYTVGGVVVGGTSGAYGFIDLDADSGSTGTLTITVLSGTFQSGELLTDNYGGSATAGGGPVAYSQMAVGDIPSAPTTVSPSGAALTVTTDGQYSYTATGRQTALNGQIFHLATSAYLSLDLDFVANNSVPACPYPPATRVVLTVGVVSDTVFACTDIDNDALVCALVAGTIPTGLTLQTTTCHINGTSSVANQSGVPITLLVYDPYQGYFLWPITFYPVTTWNPLPDCVHTPTQGVTCAQAINNFTYGSVTTSSTFDYSNTVAVNNVISQSAFSAAPGANVALVLSYGPLTPNVPNCLTQTVSNCRTIVQAVSVNASVVPSTGCTLPSSVIYSQGPGVAAAAPSNFALTVFCR